jgi:DNA-binding transcriptional regulator YdaS (Cro superfamily)
MTGMDLIRDRRGLIAKIAKGLNIHASAISMWAKVPAERLPDVERITGIPRHDLRPDICPPPGAAPHPAPPAQAGRAGVVA